MSIALVSSPSPSPKPAVITLEGVALSMGSKEVLKDLNVSFPAHCLTYILGRSGAGKSVMMRLMLGLLEPDEGNVFVNGQRLNGLKPQEQRKLLGSFGVLFQDSALFDHLSVFENIAFPLREHTKLTETEISQRVRNQLDALRLAAHENLYPENLSGGLKKRVALARAMIQKPSILIYDEPTTGLDPVMRARVDIMIRQLQDQTPITSLVISHDLGSALQLADWIVFLHRGKIIFEGKPEMLQASVHEEVQNFLRADQGVFDARNQEDEA